MKSLLDVFKNKTLIAIEGEPGVGKSTLANFLKKRLNANVISIDDFYYPIEKRSPVNFLTGGNNIDFTKLITEVIEKHLNKETIKYSSYNCKTSSYSEVKEISHKPVLILEGSYVLRKEIIDYFDYKILLKADKNLQNERLLTRPNYNDFLEKWIPLSRDFLDDNSIEKLVDLMIKNFDI